MKLNFETGLFINNEYVPSKSGATLDVINPTIEEKFATVSAAQSEDVDLAVAAAAAAFPKWSKVPPTERAALLNNFAQLMKANTDMLGHLESSSMGCPTGTFPATMARCVAALEHCAALALTHHGRTSHQGTPGFFVTSIKQPLGVVAAIIAWNVSLLLFCFKAGPAVAAGNTVVVKSSEKSPVATLYLGRLVKAAGFPPGVINIISGLGNPAGKRMSEHPDVRKITFTGSGPTGRAIAATAANTNLKRVTLELGGKGPSIVFGDADVQRAAIACAGSIARNSGQICSVNSRVYVHESIEKQFLETYVKTYVSLVKHGDPLENTTTQGVRPEQSNQMFVVLCDAGVFKVLDFIEKGKAEGKILTGGKRAGTKGYFIEPTVFTGMPDSGHLNVNEIFGPVSIVHSFKTESEAIRRANDTEYGLTSSVYTRDMERALRVAQALETGQVGVNSANQVATDMSYSGWKQSGAGHELGADALLPFCQDKVIYIPVGVAGD